MYTMLLLTQRLSPTLFYIMRFIVGAVHEPPVVFHLHQGLSGDS